MTPALIQLSTNDLQTLLTALTSGRLSAPFSELQVSRILPKAVSRNVAADLESLSQNGFSPKHLIDLLKVLCDDRNSRITREPTIELVTSGPTPEGVTNRDTAVVVDEMFKHATKSVLVVGYAVYQGQKVFEALADRMAALPELEVCFFLDAARSKDDSSMQEIVISKFVSRFKDKQWPADRRLPKVFIDPRSSVANSTIRSSLHAKCIVVDRQQVFVSSANFTEAGQQRNIEVGVRIESNWLADRLTNHFEQLRESGILERAV